MLLNYLEKVLNQPFQGSPGLPLSHAPRLGRSKAKTERGPEVVVTSEHVMKGRLVLSRDPATCGTSGPNLQLLLKTLIRRVRAKSGLSPTLNPSRDLTLMPWEAVRAPGGAFWIPRGRRPPPNLGPLC